MFGKKVHRRGRVERDSDACRVIGGPYDRLAAPAARGRPHMGHTEKGAACASASTPMLADLQAACAAADEEGGGHGVVSCGVLGAGAVIALP